MRSWQDHLVYLAASIGGWLLGVALLVLRCTWRVRVVGEIPTSSAVLAFWHGDQLALTRAPLRSRPTVLVSRSRDGQLAAQAARLLGFRVVRGSSSRGGVGGALSLRRRLAQGELVALAVDGPRGPRGVCGSSAGRLAHGAGRPLIPVAAAARRSKRLSSWDRLLVPAPFSTVFVVYGTPVGAAPLQESLEHCGAQAWRLSEVIRTR